MENKEEGGGVLILDKWSISFQTFPKVEAYSDIANTSFDFPCTRTFQIFHHQKQFPCSHSKSLVKRKVFFLKFSFEVFAPLSKNSSFVAEQQTKLTFSVFLVVFVLSDTAGFFLDEIFVV